MPERYLRGIEIVEISSAGGDTQPLGLQILSQPQSASLYVGETTALTILATGGGSGAISHQWFKNGEIIPGATDPVYVASPPLVGADQYFCVVANLTGSIQSDVVQVAHKEVIGGLDLQLDAASLNGIGSMHVIGELALQLDAASLNGIGAVESVQSWSIINSPASYSWVSVAYANGKYIAVSVNSPNSNKTMESSDGVNWSTQQRNPTIAGWKSICYGNGMWVVVGEQSVMSGPTVGAWTIRTAPFGYWNAACYGSAGFVAVVDLSGGSGAMQSTDGITWNDSNGLPISYCNSVCFGNGIYVAVGESGSYRVATSVDGITWTRRTAANLTNWKSVTFGAGVFVAVSNGAKAMSSPDGITWTERDIGWGAWKSVCYDGNKFVAISNAADAGQTVIATSPDGITWTLQRVSGFDYWYSICAGPKVVAVANVGESILVSQ